MRAYVSTVILSLAAALSWMGHGHCMGQYPDPVGTYRGTCDCGQCGPRWTFAADVVAIQRSTTRNQPLFLNDVGANLLNSQDLDFPIEMGLQAGVIRHGPCGWDVEVAYFQVDGWAANAVVPGESYMVTDVNGANFVVTEAQARYTSAFHIGEVNLRRQWTDWLTLLAGFRMGELNEHYSAYGLGAVVPVPVTLNANTFNHLYGFQIGADAEVFNLGGPLRIDALCKAGIYNNSASQKIHQADTGTSDQTLHAERDQTTFMGEAGLVATYQVTCHLAFRASCQAVWLEGVALAPEQIGASDFTAGVATIDTHGGIFYYGGGLGLELKF